jgi:hypothetical protein
VPSPDLFTPVDNNFEGILGEQQEQEIIQLIMQMPSDAQLTGK